MDLDVFGVGQGIGGPRHYPEKQRIGADDHKGLCPPPNLLHIRHVSIEPGIPFPKPTLNFTNARTALMDTGLDTSLVLRSKRGIVRDALGQMTYHACDLS